MSDAGLIAILLVAFLLAIGLVRLLDGLVGSDVPDDGWADGPPDTSGMDPASTAGGTSTVADPGGPR